MRLRLEAVSLIECYNVLQDTDAAAGWLLGGDIGSRLSIHEVVVKVLEIVIH
jgi:hypothetical protein